MSQLAAIAFDPHIRGVLVVAVGVVVLCGSVWLIVGTNTGFRNGLLIALAGLAGWCFMMGLLWWMYGIGLVGDDPSWNAEEINFSRDNPVVTEVLAGKPRTEELPDPRALYARWIAENPGTQERVEASEGEGYVPQSLTKLVTLIPELKVELDEGYLGDWRILSEADARRGDAVASADATLIEASAFGDETSGGYTVLDVFLFGGKPAAEPETVPGERGMLESAWNRVVSTFQVTNPEQIAAVTVRKNLPVAVAPGEAPPPPQEDMDAEIVTVVLQRDLGNRRLVPALFTIFSGVLFAVFAWMLHTRDRLAERTRSEWVPAKAG